MIEPRIAYDPEKPGFECVNLLTSAQSQDHLDENLLTDILPIVVVADQRITIANEAQAQDAQDVIAAKSNLLDQPTDCFDRSVQ
jgi:hypothetical protein